jgi:hypothetical protein
VTIPSRLDWGDFEAISYYWDSNIRDRDFLVDGKVIRVTSNLEALLQELQKLPEALSGMGFWVHGLCIIQEDMVEKNSQVRLMSSIYSRALSTVVWLGLPISNSNTAIDTILVFFKDDFINYPSRYGDENYRTFLTGKLDTLPVRYWSSIIDRCSRPYFRRIWTIQEQALNKNITMFMCGNKRFSRAALRGMCMFTQTNEEAIASALRTNLMKEDRVRNRHPLVWTLSHDASTLIRLREPVSLDQLLDLVRKARATDPRDMVYGMLGLLLKNIAAQIQPDYTKSGEKVFMEIAIAILSQCQRLGELLSWCVFNEASTAPSWVPDWQTTQKRRVIRKIREWKAGGEDLAEWSLCKHGRGLSVKAVRMGQVVSASLHTHALLPYKASDRPHASQNYTGPTYGRYVDNEELAVALERTLMLGRPKRRKGGRPIDLPWVDWAVESEQKLELVAFLSDPYSYLDRFRQSNAGFTIFVALRDFFAGINGPDPPSKYTANCFDPATMSANPSHIDDLKRAAVALQHRRLCITQTGLLCLAPDEVKFGDTVAILLAVSTQYYCNYLKMDTSTSESATSMVS